MNATRRISPDLCLAQGGRPILRVPWRNKAAVASLALALLRSTLLGAAETGAVPSDAPRLRSYEGPTRTDIEATTLDGKAVLLHCQWMRQYGIDGVFLSRFIGEAASPSRSRHVNQVLANVREGCHREGRV